ncbi:Fibrinogen-like protein 1,Tenascin,Fibrinogen C domain-containing protein 1-A,Techylectin-5B,Ficolin-2,Tenascin-R,Ficolin-1,Fibrinogen C domain-containing protein 1-B,Fibrinogen C domain-containing protein 1 [Mytilus coruscus]|uniref:Fibrinogen C-terminal domain-containing protein n=1 Tax=Mytilus coruscus TaxID=42192 RepID=A0A6J8AN31_MYTCO|nr:Fibrinogen-like protein 1,Tenascin,Fibrinogen C domain-containing protein 1-A,Techylectin-5B,Ficolin-2,Tenascin-R,Ficolin-1,Fibrinogen C domain-containing protein 1-B,Fibrinogen C domain-containing protein 1 [Mytilus coruscus]
MASPQIELESYEQLNRAEDQHTYEDMKTTDHEDKSTDQKDNKIVHEVNISWTQWTKIFMLTLIVSIVSACTVLTVSYVSLFAKLEVIMENNIALLKTKQNISAAQIHASNTERAELREKIEHVEKNYTFLMTKQNTLDDFITTIGNQKINELTSKGRHELRVDLTDFEGNAGYAKYSTFSVGNVSTQYKLNIGGYSGIVGDSLKENNGMRFTTKDRDNDHWPLNCANQYNGAWWYRGCTIVNLNGQYIQGGQIDWKGITWYNWTSSQYSMKSSVMMFRKVYPPG